jgi:hypothetical protein
MGRVSKILEQLQRTRILSAVLTATVLPITLCPIRIRVVVSLAHGTRSGNPWHALSAASNNSAFIWYLIEQNFSPVAVQEDQFFR